MAWRGQGITGSNNIPLGNRRRFGGSDSAPDDGGYNPAQPSTGFSDSNYKRGRSPERRKILVRRKISSFAHSIQQQNPWSRAREDARREIAGVMLRRTRPLVSWVWLPWSKPTWPMSSLKPILCTCASRKSAKSWGSTTLSQLTATGKQIPSYPFESPSWHATSLGLHPHLHSMITLVVVSIPENIAIASVWKMNAINRLKRPWKSFLTTTRRRTIEDLLRRRRKSMCQWTIIQRLTSVW